MSDSKFIKISKTEAYESLDHKFNPPELGGNFSEDDFYDEWDTYLGQLRAILNDFGEEDKFEQKDYILHEFPSLRREFGVNITSDRLINPVFIKKVSMWLSSIEKDYQVCLVMEIPHLEGYVFITKNRVRGYCSYEISKQLGFSEAETRQAEQ